MKKVVIYGNCHTTVIKDMLRLVDEFNKEYEIVDIMPIQNIKDPEYLNSISFLSCDVFVHQSIRVNNRYGEEYASENIIAKLKPECQVIAIPNVYHMPLCFFPNYSSEPEFLYRNGATNFFRDKIIDGLYKENAKINEIIKAYRDPNIFNKNQLWEQYNKFMEKLRLREKQWDIKVSEFIDSNKSEHQLFYDPNHPTNFFLAYITRKLLEILGISYINVDLESNEISRLDLYEMPICESVKKCFSMVYQEKEIRITGNKVKHKKMFLEEYIRQYTAMEWQNQSLNFVLRLKSKIRWIAYKIYNRAFVKFMK